MPTFDFDAHRSKGAAVRWRKSPQGANTGLHGAVASKEHVPKKHSDFLNVAVARQYEGGQEIALAVAASLHHWYLRAGDHHGLGESFQHEGKGRGREGQGVCSMQHHKSVKEAVEFLENSNFVGALHMWCNFIEYLDILCHAAPILHGHIAWVKKRIVLQDWVDDASFPLNKAVKLLFKNFIVH